MESKCASRLGNTNDVSSSFGDHGVSIGFVRAVQHSEGENNDKMAQKLSGKLSPPALHYDPSYSGDVDPYTMIILAQL